MEPGADPRLTQALRDARDRKARVVQLEIDAKAAAGGANRRWPTTFHAAARSGAEPLVGCAWEDINSVATPT